MIFTADCMVLKGESKPFIGRDGKEVKYAKATFLDNVGNVFEAGIPFELVGSLEALRQKVAVCEFELSKTTNKEGRPSLKLRMLGIVPRK